MFCHFEVESASLKFGTKYNIKMSGGLPSKLADDFTPTVPAGWDCTTTEDLKIDFADATKKAAHDACDVDRIRTFTSCCGDGFEQGEHEAKK